MSPTANHILFLSGSLEERENENGESYIVFTGPLDPACVGSLKAEAYQREVFPPSVLEKIFPGLKSGRCPTIYLACEGGDYEERNGKWTIREDVFVVDGWQRVNAALLMMKQGNTCLPRLRVELHFCTTYAVREALFRILNLNRRGVSPSIVLRNDAAHSPALNALYKLTDEKNTDFPLAGRVCWDQMMKRKHLIRARAYLGPLGNLHARFGPGKSVSSKEMGLAFQKIAEVTGQNILKDNSKLYYKVIDESWNIRDVAFRESASYLRETMLTVVADFFAEHEEFWSGTRLVIDDKTKRKLASFPVADPTVRDLAGSSGKAKDALYIMFSKHMTKYLPKVPRKAKK